MYEHIVNGWEFRKLLHEITYYKRGGIHGGPFSLLPPFLPSPFSPSSLSPSLLFSLLLPPFSLLPPPFLPPFHPLYPPHKRMQYRKTKHSYTYTRGEREREREGEREREHCVVNNRKLAVYTFRRFGLWFAAMAACACSRLGMGIFSFILIYSLSL